MIDFLENNVAYGSVVIIDVEDATKGDNFTDEQVAYMEHLGATDDCFVKIGKILNS